ncbi:MAG: tRNA uridine(34) 5-carboxymethylaminomethyl modification radical SAM/GNAT enzyme Elp3, partial [Candidatus Methanofastidiosia archaeon]
MDSERALREMADEVLQGKIKTVGDLQRRKIEFSKKHKLSRVLKNSEILSILKQKRVPSLLLKKPVRTLSGVTVVSVMSRPHPCPHGRCTFCPGGGDVPQSYTGFEPASRRGIQHDFDAFSQIVARLSQLEAIGHPTDKCELIVMGGTFLSQKGEYQREFVKRCFDALNERESNSLRRAQSLNERARHRCVGLTFETRPDWCRESHISKMLNFGGTRVELGVQTIYDDVYERVKREHLVEDVIKATELLKDSGLKACYHMMPGLPGSDFERDFKAFKTIFSQEKFKPDMIKFYPCLVLKGTELYEDWKKGEFVPLNTKKALELLIEVKKLMPRWVRTMRITRDIPSNLIEAGVKKTNLGQMLYLE